MSVITKQILIFGIGIFVLFPIIYYTFWGLSDHVSWFQLVGQSFISAVLASILFFIFLKYWYRKKAKSTRV